MTIQKLIHKARARGQEGEADQAQAELDRMRAEIKRLRSAAIYGQDQFGAHDRGEK